MSLQLKIFLVESGQTKTMRFPEVCSVDEAGKLVSEKFAVPSADHQLFFPAHENDKNTVGKWMSRDRTLEYYQLSNNDTLQYRKRHEQLKVKLPDQTQKTVLTDVSQPVGKIVELVCGKIKLNNPEEYSLQAENKQGDWLKHDMTLHEQVSTMEQAFMLKKKFFMTDATVSTDDPVQLHLVYCQSRDDILAGKHPVSQDEVAQFAALQAQIQIGNFNPEIHKSAPVKELVPTAHLKDKNIEQRIMQEWKKFVGTNEVNAKYRYIQLCRSLKTYGMTIFKVQDRGVGSKKLQDSILGFTRTNIIRMEYETRKVIKEYKFSQLQRWAASPETFTMDFGSYEEDYIVVVTKEGEQISNLIAGYIDLLLKRQKSTGNTTDDDNSNVAEVSNVGRIGGVAVGSTTTSMVGTGTSYSTSVTDCATASMAIDKMMKDMF